MKKRLFALLLAGLLAVSAAGCADKPDFELSGPQTVGAYTFYQVGDESAEEDPLLKTNLYYIYGKCQKIITEDTAGGKMTAVYLQVKHAGKTNYIVLSGATADELHLDESKIVGKTIVVYGTLLDNILSDSSDYKDELMISPICIQIDGEIISSTEFFAYLQTGDQKAKLSTPAPTAEPVGEFCEKFQSFLDMGEAVEPDYATYSRPASENGKADTYIVMRGTIDKVYQYDNWLNINFSEGKDKNQYSLGCGTYDEKLEKVFTLMIGKEVEVYACYQGFSDVTNTPAAMLFEVYYNGTVYNDAFLHWVSDGLSVEAGVDISSTPEPTSTPTPEEEAEASREAAATTEQRNAVYKAKDYLKVSPFSHDGLVKQLEFEGFATDDATYGADYCGADWDEQAVKSAKNYLSFAAFSYSGLIEQLEFEQFTADQATYGVDNCGADWDEQAVKKAEEYMSFMDMSHSELVGQLEFDGFTAEQAEYGVTQAEK
jgi:hypothetical protein